ncbi:27035_t:CDS:1, partial [Racocetra persica]
NLYISNNIDNDNYFQYKSKTEEYLAMLFAEWIKVNVVSGTELPPGIPDTIAGSRRKREEDSDDDESRRSKAKGRIS